MYGVFIDPLVAVGYRTGTGDLLFKTVRLPLGVGEFVVEGIASEALLDPARRRRAG